MGGKGGDGKYDKKDGEHDNKKEDKYEDHDDDEHDDKKKKDMQPKYKDMKSGGYDNDKKKEGGKGRQLAGHGDHSKKEGAQHGEDNKKPMKEMEACLADKECSTLHD